MPNQRGKYKGPDLLLGIVSLFGHRRRSRLEQGATRSQTRRSDAKLGASSDANIRVFLPLPVRKGKTGISPHPMLIWHKKREKMVENPLIYGPGGNLSRFFGKMTFGSVALGKMANSQKSWLKTSAKGGCLPLSFLILPLSLIIRDFGKM
jgi:hypothetical protein